MTGVQTCALPICFPVTIARVYDPMIEQAEQETEQMPVDANIDLSQLNLPDVVQQNEVQ